MILYLFFFILLVIFKSQYLHRISTAYLDVLVQITTSTIYPDKFIVVALPVQSNRLDWHCIAPIIKTVQSNRLGYLSNRTVCNLSVFTFPYKPSRRIQSNRLDLPSPQYYPIEPTGFFTTSFFSLRSPL